MFREFTLYLIGRKLLLYAAATNILLALVVMINHSPRGAIEVLACSIGLLILGSLYVRWYRRLCGG